MGALRDLLSDPQRVADLSPEDAATALVELASLQAAVAARLRAAPASSPSPDGPAELDRMLTADEVAGLLNRSRAWVYRQSKHWPFTRRLTRRTLRFSEAGLQRFLTQRRAFAP